MGQSQYARTFQLLGVQNMEKIKNARVALFGLGAVGSFAMEALARTGVGALNLIDFDTIDASNINRPLLALNSTIGMQKTDLACERIKDINPDCNVTIHNSFINEASLGDLIMNDIDVVVDAIDGLNSKVNLLVEASNLNLNIASF
jgi:tRNA threonylcarbamoyladenosine dehydratase